MHHEGPSRKPGLAEYFFARPADDIDRIRCPPILWWLHNLVLPEDGLLAQGPPLEEGQSLVVVGVQELALAQGPPLEEGQSLVVVA